MLFRSRPCRTRMSHSELQSLRRHCAAKQPNRRCPYTTRKPHTTTPGNKVSIESWSRSTNKPPPNRDYLGDLPGCCGSHAKSSLRSAGRTVGHSDSAPLFLGAVCKKWHDITLGLPSSVGLIHNQMLWLYISLAPSRRMASSLLYSTSIHHILWCR